MANIAVEKRLTELRKKIEYHSDLYYNQDNPEISDYEFDMMMQELKKLEAEYPELITPDSPTQKVGGEAKRELGVLVKHDVPMLSLKDVFSQEEVLEFVENCQATLIDPEFVVEEKIDGLSLAIRYRHGEIERAITRGDGINQGEDVTLNALQIKDVKRKLKEPIPYLEIRGEVYMKLSSFDEVNKQQELMGKKLFANPRNCAAGTLRQLDAKITKERKLSMFTFNLQKVEGVELNAHTEAYDFMKANGIAIIKNYKVCKTAAEVLAAIEDIGNNRGQLDYDIDGAVVKINSFAQREQLGTTSKVPKWAVAYKYPPEEKETELLNIELSVGRTGRITPTAVFKPVRLCGTKVERATLHNQDYINQLDIRIGDTIKVYKSGEIIPKVSGVVLAKRPAEAQPYILPAQCPVCHHDVIKDDKADIRCSNPHCPAQIEGWLTHFVARDAMDIKGFGTKYVEALIAKGYVVDPGDIYYLHERYDDLLADKIFGKEKNTDKLLKAIEDSKTNAPWRLLAGLGILNIGKAASVALMNHFKSFDNLAAATIESILEVDDIGEISAKLIYDFFQDELNQQLLNKFKNAGVQMKEEVKELVSSKLAGLTFVITGTMENYSRQAAAEAIEFLGGKVTNSVSKKTNYLVAGEKAGSKLDKATKLGVPILDEEAFKRLISEE